MAVILYLIVQWGGSYLIGCYVGNLALPYVRRCRRLIDLFTILVLVFVLIGATTTAWSIVWMRVLS